MVFGSCDFSSTERTNKDTKSATRSIDQSSAITRRNNENCGKQTSEVEPGVEIYIYNNYPHKHKHTRIYTNSNYGWKITYKNSCIIKQCNLSAKKRFFICICSLCMFISCVWYTQIWIVTAIVTMNIYIYVYTYMVLITEELALLCEVLGLYKTSIHPSHNVKRKKKKQMPSISRFS